MKKIYITFLFLIAFNGYSQINSGRVIYSVKVNPNSLFQKEQVSLEMNKVTNKIYQIIPTLEFSLSFNKEISVFNLKRHLSLDLTEFCSKMAILISQGNKTIYCDIENRVLLEHTSFQGDDFIVKSSIDDFKWHLSKEKKLIGKYWCYKADAIKEMTIQGKLEKFYYTAWYCPEIPLNYGPVNINGLPGIVLELSNKHLIYYAKEIELSKNKIMIEKPKNGKIITRNEFETIWKNAFETINR